MRQGEVLGLKWSDINMERRVLYIRRRLSHDGKKINPGAKSRGSLRSLALSSPVIEALMEQHKLISSEQRNSGMNTPISTESVPMISSIDVSDDERILRITLGGGIIAVFLVSFGSGRIHHDNVLALVSKPIGQVISVVSGRLHADYESL